MAAQRSSHWVRRRTVSELLTLMQLLCHSKAIEIRLSPWNGIVALSERLQPKGRRDVARLFFLE